MSGGFAIEHGPHADPVCLTGHASWSRDRSKAILFAREQDADAFIREWLASAEGLRVREHRP